ncbi:hypothetical protein [Paraburkholderia sp. CI3]|uniref:hypothetical protein n=1 Tax=Paraburkholderia sp. CI3 TaxID=2991060 RepID=UPI003D1E0F40
MAFSFKLKGGVALYSAYAAIAAVAFAAAFAAPSISAASAAVSSRCRELCIDYIDSQLALIGASSRSHRHSKLRVQ